MNLRLLLIVCALSSTAYAESWVCRNNIEIRCASGNCSAEAKDAFTPMSVSFSDSGKMSVCAYSGCWEGTGRVFDSERFLILTGKSLKFSTASNPGQMRQDVAISLDRKDNVAILKAGEFAHPLICESKTPTFEEYKTQVYGGKARPIVFRGNRDAWMFRTRLRRARKSPANFAGHFIFTTWGCGTSCVVGALINAKTGRVYFPKEFGGMGFGFGAPVSDEPFQFQKDSRLFILNGIAANSKQGGTTYLVWQGTRFKKAKFVPSKKDDTR